MKESIYVIMIIKCLYYFIVLFSLRKPIYSNADLNSEIDSKFKGHYVFLCTYNSTYNVYYIYILELPVVYTCI